LKYSQPYSNSIATPKNFWRKKILSLSTVFSCIAFVFNGYCQNNKANDIVRFFDSKIGTNTLGINNGTIHQNSYKTLDKSFPYYNNQYQQGTVYYDGQLYTDVSLKYDEYADVLIAKMDGANNTLGINLITEKTDFFSLDGKKFICLRTPSATQSKFLSGFYEEHTVGANLIFYVKHRKTRLETLTTDALWSSFQEKKEFVLGYRTAYTRIASRKDLVKLFPNYESKITEYYTQNRMADTSDSIEFVGGLIQFLDGLIATETTTSK